MLPTSKKSIAAVRTSSLLLLPLMGCVVWGLPQIASAPARADLAPEQLTPVSPDESARETLRNRFSLPNALEHLRQTRDALSSFVRLTEKNRAVGSSAIADIGNTDWETQNLGFVNWTGAIEGTLRQQDYQLKKLELELARKQYEDGEISPATLQEKKTAYQQAEQEFQTFWNSFGIVD